MIRLLAILLIVFLFLATLGPGCARPVGLQIPAQDELLPWAWRFPSRHVPELDANEYE
jgi:hypothetical protein